MASWGKGAFMTQWAKPTVQSAPEHHGPFDPVAALGQSRG